MQGKPVTFFMEKSYFKQLPQILDEFFLSLHQLFWSEFPALIYCLCIMLVSQLFKFLFVFSILPISGKPMCCSDNQKWKFCGSMDSLIVWLICIRQWSAFIYFNFTTEVTLPECLDATASVLFMHLPLLLFNSRR